MSTRTFLLFSTLLLGCASAPELGAHAGARRATPAPTPEDPFNGLPALSGDGQLMALPTYTSGAERQERSITFIAVGDLESPGKTVDLPATPSEPQISALADQYQVNQYASLPWVITPNDPPLPMTITVNHLELYFAGDPRTQLSVVVNDGDKTIGRDVFHVEGVSETSPERVVAVGATVLWKQDHGYAYVRYDVNDGEHRDSEWRVVALTKAGVTTQPATPSTPTTPSTSPAAPTVPTLPTPPATPQPPAAPTLPARPVSPAVPVAPPTTATVASEGVFFCTSSSTKDSVGLCSRDRAACEHARTVLASPSDDMSECRLAAYCFSYHSAEIEHHLVRCGTTMERCDALHSMIAARPEVSRVEACAEVR